jgi:hypothetical protein
VDLYRLIDLAGYDLIYVDEIDAARVDATYILTMLNGEWYPAGWPGARARIVLYDLEWHLDGLAAVPGLAEVWAADAWYARRLGARYVPLGSHPGLALGARLEARYDVAMLAYLTPRRQQIYDQLRDAGLRMAPNGQGEARDVTLRETRLMLHVHQLENAPTVAPQRFALAAAYGLPLLSEEVADSGIFRDGPVWFANTSRLSAYVHALLARPDVLCSYGEGLRDWLCERYAFRKCVEAAL